MNKAGQAQQAMPAESRRSAARIAFTGMLGALSMVLMLIRVPLPFAPSFLEFDISELPALFAGFFLGPLAGEGVILVKILLKLAFQGTGTAFVGEMSNVLLSSVFVLSAALYYRGHKTRKGAIVSMVIGTVLVTAAGVFTNAFIMFPLYSKLYGMPMDAIIAMGSAVNPLVTDEVTLMLFAVAPFNLVKHGITSLLTFLLYKRCGNAIRNLVASR